MPKFVCSKAKRPRQDLSINGVSNKKHVQSSHPLLQQTDMKDKNKSRYDLDRTYYGIPVSVCHSHFKHIL